MKTKELQTLWWDWLSTSERLLRSLHEQTAALTLRDVARVERIQPELTTMLGRMRELDDQAVACVEALAESMGIEPKIRSLARALDKAEAQQLEGLANRVLVAGRHVQSVIEKNRKLIENEMSFINGTFALVAKVTPETEGQFGVKENPAILVDQAA